MNLREMLGGGKPEDKEPASSDPLEESVKQWVGKEIDGKIIKIELAKGWGFISSTKVPFTRIFFHWTALVQDTLHFTEFRKGMKVNFILTYKEGKGFTAVKVKADESELEPLDDNTESA